MRLINAPDGWAPWRDWRAGHSDYGRGRTYTITHFRRPNGIACSMVRRFAPDAYNRNGWLWLSCRFRISGQWPKDQAEARRSSLKFPLPGVAYIDNGTGYGGDPGTSSRPGASIRWRYRWWKGRQVLGLYIYHDDAPGYHGREVWWMTDHDLEDISAIRLGVNWRGGKVKVQMKVGAFWRTTLTLDGLAFPKDRYPYLWWHGWRRPMYRGGSWDGDASMRIWRLRVGTNKRDVR